MDFAVLDIQWSRHPDVLGELLAVATSTGLLAFYRLATDGCALVPLCVKRISDASTLVLSLTWHPIQPHVLGLTLSDGSVVLCECREQAPWSQDAVIRVSNVHHHDLEAWTLAFTPQSSNVLSGGDDIVLQCSAINEDAQDPTLLWKDRRTHGAGITAILPLSDVLIVTGSYDDHIRLLSAPSTGRRQLLAELNLGGGVWRLKVLHRGTGTISHDHESSALSDLTRYVSVPFPCPPLSRKNVRRW